MWITCQVRDWDQSLTHGGLAGREVQALRSNPLSWSPRRGDLSPAALRAAQTHGPCRGGSRERRSLRDMAELFAGPLVS